ncbi:HCNGP-like protein-domain-containing protein [Cokeromyces recurvatus]|uniref:HCNGP-like protein-domain-containing protein n=1 Tax=Cokeromyces recurvatus TaxID=90255 RepID=UPI00221E5F95|nr:HCNGP-like protein-domain-containing protein [Cokeromyces recurvatus]KAI7905102.1 HCNGP-like protein-domain-containing protein [Cokeromyces recurvatus]
MSSLAGLVNYSDEEDSSSSDEQPVAQIVQDKKPIRLKTSTIKEKPIENSNSQTSSSVSTIKKAVSVSNPPLLLNQEGSIIEYNKRLLAVLTPKPVEGVVNWGIPDEPNIPCDPERTERIAHFLSLKASGHHLNKHLQHNKSFRNPRIYAKLVEFTGVDEFGSNFDKTQFDPHGFPKEMYIDGILETQRRLAEEKAAQQQNRNSINFVPQQQELTPQQSSAMAQAMATAAKIASRITKPPTIENKTSTPLSNDGEKRKKKWDDEYGSSSNKRR